MYILVCVYVRSNYIYIILYYFILICLSLWRFCIVYIILIGFEILTFHWEFYISLFVSLCMFNFNLNTMEILSNLSSGNANIEAIKAQLFEVQNVPLYTNIDKFTPPNAFGIYKTTGGQPFGVLGKDFTPQQPVALFDSFTQCLIENTNADLSKVKYHEMKGGAKIRFEVPIKTIGFTNLKGQQDESIISLNIQTGFDGYTATSLYLSLYRMVCANGMKANVTEFKSKFKNTIGNVGKVQLLCDDVTKALDTSDNLTETLTRLNKIEITTARKNEFIKAVLGYNNATKEELTTRKRNILQKVEESIALEISRSGGNLWGLLNGITYYTNHQAREFKSVEESTQYIFCETGESLNKKAFDTVMAMAN